MSLSRPATAMPSAVTDKHCHLLDLPVELLQRITNLLDPHETLPAVRLACKVLDDVSFERFARTSFSVVSCCIFYEQRWLRLKEILDGPSRITERIEHVNLTICVSENIDSTELQLAPTAVDTDVPLEDVQILVHEAQDEARTEDITYPPNFALMSRVLRDVERVLPPGAVTLNLIQGHTRNWTNYQIEAHCEALLTMASTQAELRIRSLYLSPNSMLGLDRSLAHLRQETLRCTSELKMFKLFRPLGYEVVLELDDMKTLNHMCEILRSATELHSQHFSLGFVNNFKKSATIARNL